MSISPDVKAHPGLYSIRDFNKNRFIHEIGLNKYKIYTNKNKKIKQKNKNKKDHRKKITCNNF